MARPPKVLIVDDEASILASTSAMLEALGYEVATCGLAEAILASVAREAPDVILQDVRMPGLDIAAVVGEMRSDPRWRRLPIVVFTASMEADEVASRISAVCLLEKPFRPEELVTALDKALGAA